MRLLRIFLNELSLAGAANREVVRKALAELMEARRRSPNLARVLYCSRRTAVFEAVDGEQLITSISSLPRDEKVLLLTWLTQKGPFFDDEHDQGLDDEFYFAGANVTEFALGEAVRQIRQGNDARSLSYTFRTDIDFRRSQLPVVCCSLELPDTTVDVPNISEIGALLREADLAVPEPQSWPELLTYCRDRYSGLLIGSHCDNVLRSHAFYPNVSRRTIALLQVLNSIVAEMRPDGSFSVRGEELTQSHFVGEKAWFTGESDDNERMFASEMTFPDPAGGVFPVRYFWHGKIKTPQFRIHFEWPLPRGARSMRIAYIGPKISKK